MTSRPLNGKELAAALGIGETTYRLRKKAGLFRSLEVSRPIGQRRYSAELVRRYLAGESVTAFGAGRDRLRRAS